MTHLAVLRSTVRRSARRRSFTLNGGQSASGLDPTHAGPEPHLGARAGVRVVLHLREHGRLGEGRPDREPERHPPLPWHVVPLAASDNGLSETYARRLRGPRNDGVDRRDGGRHLVRRPVPPRDDRSGREPRRGRHRRGGCPVVHGRHDRRGRPRGCPTGVDEFAGISWLDFLTDDNTTRRARRDRRADLGRAQRHGDARGRRPDRRRRRRRLRRRGAPGRLPGREARRTGWRGLRLRPLPAEPVRRRAPRCTSPTTATTTATSSGWCWTLRRSVWSTASPTSRTASRRAPGRSPATCRDRSATRRVRSTATPGRGTSCSTPRTRPS